jgi:hypothetical protein
LNLLIENGTRDLKTTMGFANFPYKGNRVDKRKEAQKYNMLIHYILTIRHNPAFDVKVFIQTADIL